jgi:hypothetical protein
VLPLIARNNKSAIRECRVPLRNNKGNNMPNIDVTFNSSLIAIERPPCPKCDGQMIFTSMVSGRPDFDIRTFECNACDYAEKIETGANRRAG